MRVRTLAAALIAAAALGYETIAGTGLSPSTAIAAEDYARRGRPFVVTHDPAGADTGTNRHLNRELATLLNSSARTHALNGWTLRDKLADHNVYTFPRTRLRPGQGVTIHTGSGDDRRGHRYWGLDVYVWDNRGDRATLRERDGELVDICSFKYPDADGTDSCNHRTILNPLDGAQRMDPLFR